MNCRISYCFIALPMAPERVNFGSQKPAYCKFLESFQVCNMEGRLSLFVSCCLTSLPLLFHFVFKIIPICLFNLGFRQISKVFSTPQFKYKIDKVRYEIYTFFNDWFKNVCNRIDPSADIHNGKVSLCILMYISRWFACVTDFFEREVDWLLTRSTARWPN